MPSNQTTTTSAMAVALICTWAVAGNITQRTTPVERQIPFQSNSRYYIPDAPTAELKALFAKLKHDGAEPSLEVMTDVVKSAIDFVLLHGPSAIRLDQLNPRGINGELLAALLRGLGNWKDELTGWENALDIAEVALVHAALDPTEVLYGLR